MHHPSIALRLAVALSLLATAWPCLQEMAFAAVPEAINFQGIARRPDGTPISSQAVKIRATILRTAANGTIVYQETLTATTSAGGQFSIQLGTGLLVQGVFTTINWSAFPHFLRIEIDPAGGNAFVDMGTQQ